MLLKQYIRDDRNNPVGIMLAEKRNDTIHIGWSICHKRDNYSKQKGEMIATCRLKAQEANQDTIPRKYHKAINNFIDRAHKYFCKNA